MRQLLDKNHSKLLKKAILEKRNDILNEYDKFIAKKINSYLEVLRLLQKYLYYVNSDIKLTNIFIKKSSNQETDILSKYGFITNFETIMADLEKSSININHLKITTEPSLLFKFVIPLSKLIRKGLVYDVRYGCNTKMKTCSKIDILDYDVLSVVIDLFVQLITIKTDILDDFTELSKCIISYLGNTMFTKLKHILEEGKYKINGNYSLKIGNIISKLCK
jgi:hypothetical protein